MNETASFAMDDVILYLDTHPDDRQALEFYRTVTAMRREAVKAYEDAFGPLSIDANENPQQWDWITRSWPWEGEV